MAKIILDFVNVLEAIDAERRESLVLVSPLPAEEAARRLRLDPPPEAEAWRDRDFDLRMVAPCLAPDEAAWFAPQYAEGLRTSRWKASVVSL